VNDCDRRLQTRVGKVLVEAWKLGRFEQPFIDEGTAREASDVEAVTEVGEEFLNPRFDALAEEVERAFLLIAFQRRGRRNKHLFDKRSGSASHGADRREDHGYGTPTEQIPAFLSGDFLRGLTALGCEFWICR
jgi:hypothetical protein